MSSTKMSAPRTLDTLPSAWIIAIAACLHAVTPGGRFVQRTVPPGGRLSPELTPNDREPLVLDRDRETGRDPEFGRRRARRVRAGRTLRIGLDGGEAAPAQIVADGADQLQGVPPTAGLGGRRDAGDDRRQRRLRQLRIEVAEPLGARIRRERTELTEGNGYLFGKEDLGVAPEDGAAAPEQAQLAWPAGHTALTRRTTRGERVVGERVVVERERVEGRLGRWAGEGIDGCIIGVVRAKGIRRSRLRRGRRRGLEPRRAGRLGSAVGIFPVVA